MAKITPEEIKHIAELSWLDVSNEEKQFAEMFSDTLEKIKTLNELDTSNVLETYQVTGQVNIFQTNKDQRVTLTQEEALSNGNEIIDGKFSTKGVFS